MNPIYSEFKRRGTCSIQKEIAEFLRQIIENGSLAPGEKLPPLRALADFWNTNFFSVKLATDDLTELGFLTKQQGRGVFVAPSKEKIRCIGLYFSNSDNNARQYVSFQTIQGILCRKLAAAGYSYVFWLDCRPEEEHSKPPEELTRAIISGQVQSVAGISLRTYDKKWFNALPVKKASIMMDRFPDGGWDRIADSMRNCKRPAAIATATDPGHSFVVDALKNAGIHFMPRRIRILDDRQYLNKDWVELGYQYAKELLDVPSRPDALLVYPDNMAPGIFYAIYQLGIKVPEDLLLIMHRNVEMDYFTPFPVIYLDTKLENIANRMFHAVTGLPEN